jgi:Protein of unknown function (DUF3574)
MLHVVRGALCALLLVLTTVTPSLTEARQEEGVRIRTDRRAVIQRPVPAGARTGALPFARTELYFGTARPHGVVTEAEFRDFVDHRVTPWFSDGLTLVKGEGQFRGDGNTLVKEQSFVLILLYPYDTLDMSSRRIEQIRAVYKEEFDQQSVLRVDAPFIVWASF